MKRQDFTDALVAHNFKSTPLQLFGVIDDYPIRIACPTLRQIRYFAVSVMLEFNVDRTERKALVVDLKGLTKRVGCTNKMLEVTIKCDRRETADSLWQKISSIIPALRRNNIYPPTNCAICQGPDTDAWMSYKLRYEPVHQRCIHQEQKKLVRKIQQNKGSVLLGLVGAIIGAFIGCIPNILTIWFADTIYSLLYALMPLCAYYGYKLFRGKMNWLAPVISVLTSLLGVYLIEFVLVNVFYATEYNMGLEVLTYTLPLLKDPEFLLGMTVDSIQSFFFLLLGLLVVWRSITKTHKRDLKEVRNSMDTILVREGVEPLPADALLAETVQENEFSTVEHDLPSGEPVPEIPYTPYS